MKYVYPKFPDYDLSVFRIGGCGLGNLLFIYSRALVYAVENDFKFIWPTWASVKFGPYIRHEKDKRRYNDLFVNKSGYIDGLKKAVFLMTKHMVHESQKDNVHDDNVVVFDISNYSMSFKGLYEYRKLIYDDIVRNLNDKNRGCLKCDFSHGLCVHIRLGDFIPPSEQMLNENINNVSTPVEWFAEKITEIREAIDKKMPVYVFSDGYENQLAPVLKLENIQVMDMGTSIGNILALSRAKLLLASGSSTSMWARFLGDVPTIAFTNQLKENIHSEGFEEEIGYDMISDGTIEKIRLLYKE